MAYREKCSELKGGDKNKERKRYKKKYSSFSRTLVDPKFGLASGHAAKGVRVLQFK